ncbi:MAG: hypothetical protein V1929_02600 [bacterium]
MKSSFPATVAAVMVVAFALAGCGSGDEAADAGDASSGTRSSRATQLAGDRISETGVVAMVQMSSAKEGDGTMGDWVDRRLKELTGQLMFPRWQAERRGASKFEVQFTFTLIDEENRIVKRGYAWSVDVPLNLVGPTRELEPDYTQFVDGRRRQMHEERRAIEAQRSLE